MAYRPKPVPVAEPDCEVRAVPGWPGYSVSRDGRVWSHAKTTGVSRHGGHWMRTWLVAGYPALKLGGRRGKFFYIHQLVALAWVPNPEPERFRCINHKDGKRSRNVADNLEWCDHSMNLNHAYQTGLRQPRGRSPQPIYRSATQ